MTQPAHVFSGQATDDLLRAMDANLVGHMAELPARLPSCSVAIAADMVLVDAGVPSDTFNVVCGAALDPGTADQRIAEAIAHFARSGAPFTWWVSPTSQPADLGRRLMAHGFVEAEAEIAMALNLDLLPGTVPQPDGVTVRRAETAADLDDFARVMAANWEPPDAAVMTFYQRASAVALAPAFPARFYVGYLHGVPVATSECFLGGGVAGLYAITTLPAARRRGIGAAMTLAPLRDAQVLGYRTATLQASAAGEPVYRRIGFVPVGHVQEYKLPDASPLPLGTR